MAATFEARWTGRTRYRQEVKKRWGQQEQRMLVLQLEITDLSTDCIGGQVDSEWVHYWRDATVEDLFVGGQVADLNQKQPTRLDDRRPRA